MDDRTLELVETLVTPRYIQAGVEALHSNARVLRSLVAQQRCPDDGLSDSAVESLLHQLAMMDTNNFPYHVGAGEREGRVVSSLVRRRMFGLTHGIGRSGDLTSDQPKAGGSSLLYQLTNLMVLDLIRQAGAASTAAAIVVPMATGMTLSLVLRCVANEREKEVAQAATASASPSVPPRCVIWPRVDQKTALKCIVAAGLEPVPVALRHVGPPSAHQSVWRACTTTTTDASPAAVVTDGTGTAAAASSACFLQVCVDDIAAAVEAAGGPSRVACVLSTTSCFAPRLPDDTLAIARYCQAQGIPYVVNNAYGVQSRSVMSRLEAAQRLGRVDYFVQSGDKNFLVPVGGSVLCSPNKASIRRAAALYAGRASASPALDLFITALSLGRNGMNRLWEERYARRQELVHALHRFAHARGEVLLVEDDISASPPAAEVSSLLSAAAPSSLPQPPRNESPQRKQRYPRNDISLAVTMRHYTDGEAEKSTTNEGEGGAPGTTSSPSPSAEAAAAAAASGTTTIAAARRLGAKLFRSGVTGPRVVLPAPDTATTIAGCVFYNYGMHEDGQPPCPLLVLACGIGMTVEDVTGLMVQLEKLWPVRERAAS